MSDSEPLACASMQSDQALRNFFTESLDAVEYLNGQLGADKTFRMHIQANLLHIRTARPWSDCANAQSDQDFCCPLGIYVFCIPYLRTEKALISGKPNNASARDRSIAWLVPSLTF